MYNKIYRRNNIAVILLMLCTIWYAVCGSERTSPPATEYTVPPIEDIVLHGYDINKLITMTFLEIEKEWDNVTQIDSEVGVIFNTKYTDLVHKKFETDIDDCINAEYFPIVDISIYDTCNRKYYSMIPVVISIYGRLSFKEDSLTKEFVLKELYNVMPETDAAKKIIQTIRKSFILDEYEEDITITVNFNMTNFKLAYFIIWMAEGQIDYKYLFSTGDEPYP